MYKFFMPQDGAVVTEASHSVDSPARAKRLRWLEVFLVLLVAFGGPLVTGFYWLVHGPGAAANISNVRWLTAIVQEAAALLLLGYVLTRRKLSFRNLGFHWSVRDLGAGLLVALASYWVYAVGYVLLNVLHRALFASSAAGPSPRAFFSHPGIMVIPFSLLNPFFEELIVRAYLMTEVIELTGSSTIAVALSVGIQFSYHLYYGWVGASALAFQFLIFSLYYARWRRALPVVVAHAFFDVTALFRLL